VKNGKNLQNPLKILKLENLIKIEGLLLIGGRNPLTSKEKASNK
jgi:hypothetical protein